MLVIELQGFACHVIVPEELTCRRSGEHDTVRLTQCLRKISRESLEGKQAEEIRVGPMHVDDALDVTVPQDCPSRSQPRRDLNLGKFEPESRCDIRGGRASIPRRTVGELYRFQH